MVIKQNNIFYKGLVSAIHFFWLKIKSIFLQNLNILRGGKNSLEFYNNLGLFIPMILTLFELIILQLRS